MGIKCSDTQDVRAEVVSWEEFELMVEALAEQIKRVTPHESISGIYGIPTGGSFVALALQKHIPSSLGMLHDPRPNCIVVDDIADTGNTIRPFVGMGHECHTLFISERFDSTSCEEEWTKCVFGLQVASDWVKFPWEHAAEPQDAIVRLLEFIGENPKREGLRGTPSRVCRALGEMTRGYSVDTQALIQGAVFSEVGKYDEMIVLSEIPFYSMCEHHMMPFFGTVHVGYIPGAIVEKMTVDKVGLTERGLSIGGKIDKWSRCVVGVSKIARLVEAHARRLQIQERMTDDIAHDLFDGLGCLGVGVVVCGQHLCMQARGVSKPGSVMKTSSMLGVFREKREVREEFLRLCGM